MIQGMKWDDVKLLFVGVCGGIIGVGLQNLNPLEPYDLTHWTAVGVGTTLFFGLFLVEYIFLKLMAKKNKLEVRE